MVNLANPATYTYSSVSTADACSVFIRIAYVLSLFIIQVLDRLFDIMNVRNCFGKGYKAPIRAANWPSTQAFLKEAIDYLSELKTSDGKQLYLSKRYELNQRTSLEMRQRF